MLSINGVQGDTIHATDGDFGSVDDFLFDDESWAIRYLVVDTGKWIPGRRVLISPASLKTKRGPAELTTSLSKEQIKNSPDIDTDQPVSRQFEAEYLDYLGYPYYRRGPALWGTTAYPFTRMVHSRSGIKAGPLVLPAAPRRRGLSGCRKRKTRICGAPLK